MERLKLNYLERKVIARKLINKSRHNNYICTCNCNGSLASMDNGRVNAATTQQKYSHKKMNRIYSVIIFN